MGSLQGGAELKPMGTSEWRMGRMGPTAMSQLALVIQSHSKNLSQDPFLPLGPLFTAVGLVIP